MPSVFVGTNWKLGVTILIVSLKAELYSQIYRHSLIAI